MIRVGVLGGGASGMAAAVVASRNGAEVTILERLDRVGKKLLATGNGRCNYTNDIIDMSRYYSSNRDLLEECLSNITSKSTIGFFRELGVEPFFDETGKVFPYSLQASSVLEVLREEYLRYGAKEICGQRILAIKPIGGAYMVQTDLDTFEFDRVIVAMGGKSNEKLGSDGSGFELMAGLGYELSEIYPALVKLKSDFIHLRSLKGLKVNASVSLYADENLVANDLGEVLFADYGISGPPIMQLSGIAVKKINEGKNVRVSLDFFSDISRNDLFEILSDRFINLKHKSLKDSLVGLINKRMILPLLKEAGIDDFFQKPTKMNRRQIYAIIKELKSLRINVTGFHSWADAQVTAGGVLLTEINPQTMEACHHKNLFVTGEILDVYGDCGGFNLHWAWNTGIKAGHHSSIIR
ncbi:MAG TPA: aminoacetone oxidase family FAD-binding enzyme [Clostridiales bacterium]|nr:aminoacetone oxidase family FAD-binding enzyme [Clostridiales bacterium]